jgi:phosphonate transport system substrate-binding protein
MAGLLAACSTTQAAALPYVDLSVRAPLPAVAETDERPLLIAVGAILSPQGTLDSYRELAAYLSATLDRPAEIVQRRTYAEINALIAQNRVDLAFICTSAYLDGVASGSLRLLAAPEIGGRSVYFSQLIVPASSPAQNMADLRGARFVFTDPMSLTGRVYPTYLAQQLGSTPEQFFESVSYTYSHDRAIEAVAAGVADGAAVDSLVLAYATERDPALAASIKVIHTSEAFGIPPVVVPAGLPAVSAARLRRILLDMDRTPAGQSVLSQLGIDRFVQIEDRAYESARRLAAAASKSE